MDLLNRNLNVSLKHHEEVIALLESEQEKLSLKMTEMEPKIVKSLEAKLTACNDCFNEQSKLFSYYLQFYINSFWISIQVSSMEESFHINSSEMKARNTEMVNIVRVLEETLTSKIEKNNDKLALMEKLTQSVQAELTNSLQILHGKLNETKSCQDKRFDEVVEQGRLVDQKIECCTKEKIKELMDHLEIEKIEHFEVIELLGLDSLTLKPFSFSTNC